MMGMVVRSLLRSRLPLPLIPLGSSLLIRANHSGRVDWSGSDLQGVLAAIVYLAVIPMLSIVLATGWMRGEVGPWSWALARPISRARWLGITLLVDVATLAVSVLMAWLVIGDLPYRWLGPWPGQGMRELGYAALLTIIHCSAALAGARGSSAVGGGMYAATFTGALVLARGLVTVTQEVAAALLGRQMFSSHLLWRDLTTIGSPSRLGRGPVDEVSTLALVMTCACAFIIVMLRVARSLPARARLSLAIVAFALSAIAGGVVVPLLAMGAVPFAL
jgi:hypothetical protein